MIKGCLGRFARDRDGVAAIEFAMLALPFLLLVFAILETCVSFAAQQVMSNAMDDAARELRTGRSDVATQAQLKQAICTNMAPIVSGGCTGLEVDVRSYTTYAAAAADTYTVNGEKISISSKGSTYDLKFDPGGSETINTMRVFYKWPVITDFMRSYMASVGGDKTLLFSTVTWRNEPYEN